MRRILLSTALFSLCTLSAQAAETAEAGAKLGVVVGNIDNGAPIPEKYAYCKPDAAKKTVDGGNISPEINWTEGPAGTKSYAVVMVDPDVPVSFDDANKEGKTLAEDRPRKEFVHWVLIDIAPDQTRLPEGADSAGVNPKGKPAQKTKFGLRGINDYGSTFAGYDGPCPPWNDARLHHYHFQVYALSEPTLGLKGAFDLKAVRKAMKGKILAQGESVGTYTQNLSLAAPKGKDE